MAHSSATPKHPGYESNPFLVAFRGLDNLFHYNQNLAIVLLIINVVLGFGQVFTRRQPATTNQSAPFNAHDLASHAGAIILIFLVIFAIVFGIILVWATLYGGFVSYVTWKTSRNESTSFREALNAVMQKFGTIFFAQLVVIGKIIGSSMLFIIPGIRAALRYQMVNLAIFEKDLKGLDAVRYIKQLTKDHLLEIFGMTTAASIIPVIGPLLRMGGQAVVFRQLTDLKASGASKPPVHWLNYLGFVLLIVLLAFVALIALLFIAIAKRH